MNKQEKQLAKEQRELTRLKTAQSKPDFKGYFIIHVCGAPLPEGGAFSPSGFLTGAGWRADCLISPWPRYIIQAKNSVHFAKEVRIGPPGQRMHIVV